MKLVLSVLSAATIIFAAGVSQAKASLKFENPRIFAPLKGASMTAGYVEIKNTSDKEIEIVLKSVEKFKAVETHETLEENGKMAMKKVESFKVPAKGTLELKPGGRHLMLFDPSETLKEGSSLKAIFSVDGKDETVKFKVIPRQQATEEHGHH